MAETKRGGSFYDAPQVVERYFGHRHSGVSSPNHVMEEPAFLAELGEVAGLRVLDLGCGDAAIGQVLLDAGCRSYLGLDGSAAMVEAANAALCETAGRVEMVDIEDFSAPPSSFDLIVSRLAFHYVKDIETVLAALHRCLSPGGRIVFTVVHPVLTSHDSGAREKRTSWVVDDYFVQGPREREWIGGTVTWFHRTIEDYVVALTRSGFALSSLRECAPCEDRFNGDADELARRRRVPLFLLLSGMRA
ncbi:class I SAM-dependent methyltransferase [Nonomuraea angiospora]|uniref:SAM-dependent methyltransferase n=1 Tax=Nonomuraea angiospora TaxID=46172 RepID=A0ABR9M9S1_9ACTN|nr:class I SAM-dependent methyltransferase [Nonomuraea angiospora]MBE1589365.1 SAM-dependent methyltransferase [Nonomuraea angiospora]